MTPLRRLTELGQSVWYDYIRRDLYQGPKLERLIGDDELRGMTSNPTIFAKAIMETDLYENDIERLAAGGATRRRSLNRSWWTMFAAPPTCSGPSSRQPAEMTVSSQSKSALSSRVIPKERSLKRAVYGPYDWPNVMVKIPATTEGIPAIRQCLAEGININITLLFRFRVIERSWKRISRRWKSASAWASMDQIRSVASFFVSRVDTNVNKELDAIAQDAGRPEGDRQLRAIFEEPWQSQTRGLRTRHSRASLLPSASHS